MEELTIGNVWQITQKLAKGAFGEIFIGYNMKTMEPIAIKMEPLTAEQPQLMFEARLYKYFHQDSEATTKGIPRIFYHAIEGQYNVLVMQQLGNSLGDLLTQCGDKFSLKTVILLAEQLISRLEYFHSRNFLHRDIKPDNFVMGRGKLANKVYIIDYGLSKLYSNKAGKHIPMKKKKSLLGTPRFISINAHDKLEQGRRDDLESLAYMLIYFLKGSLPWQNLRGKNKRDKYQKIKEKKLQTSMEELCAGIPEQFSILVKYAKKLKFEEKPDYSYLKKMFQTLFKELYSQEKKEVCYRFDWTLDNIGTSSLIKLASPLPLEIEEIKAKLLKNEQIEQQQQVLNCEAKNQENPPFQGNRQKIFSEDQIQVDAQKSEINNLISSQGLIENVQQEPQDVIQINGQQCEKQNY